MLLFGAAPNVDGQLQNSFVRDASLELLLVVVEGLQVAAHARQLSPQLLDDALGVLAVTVAGLAAGAVAAVSALYGAAVVVVPGALMARGATSRLSSLSPVISALSMFGWAFVKLTASVALLVLASRIVPGVIWPVLLGAMVLCMQSYWFALLWRGRAA